MDMFRLDMTHTLSYFVILICISCSIIVIFRNKIESEERQPGYNVEGQNRSTEGCSKLKRSVEMTSSGKNGLNIETNASPKWDRTRCPEE